jgi:lipopolysaccharide/colanic/teichoic acid biosynthesis glycosyltransferase
MMRCEVVCHPTGRVRADAPLRDSSLKAHELKAHGSAAGRLRRCWYGRVKTALDAGLALTMLVLASPLLLLAALLVKATSRGPILYSQIRLGRGGKPFRIYKVRSMHHDCEKHSGAQWSKPGDARVTPVGRFLRRTHIDELPQLWNVLRGDMSLVGPRPERPEFVPQLEEALPRYRERLLVRPGLSGLAQVQLPPDTDLDSVRRKLAHDLGYVERMSFWLDLRILICTALHVVGVSYAWGAKKLRLPKGAELERAYSASLIKPIETADVAAVRKGKTTKLAPPDSVDEPLVADLQPA